MSANPKLSKIALLMRNGNPEAFAAFGRGLFAYREELVGQLVKASSAEVLTAQGRVQTLDVLLRILNECHLEPRKPIPQASEGNPTL